MFGQSREMRRHERIFYVHILMQDLAQATAGGLVDVSSSAINPCACCTRSQSASAAGLPGAIARLRRALAAS
jgi:hypothetical protein